MLGLDNPIHILFLLVIVLLVFGAKRLPEMGKSLGEGLRGFKDSVSGETPAHDLTAPAPDPSPLTVIAPDTADVVAGPHVSSVERVPAQPAA
jgi:sec-independent protein translocase protein TatA